MSTSIWSIMIVVICSFLGALGSLYLKRGANRLSSNIRFVIFNINLIKGILIYGIATIAFIPALKFGELSVLYPFVALTYIWAILLSKKYLKEKINYFKWIGVILIIIGVTFIGLGSG